MSCLAGCVGSGARAGQRLLHLPADQLVPAGQGQVQGAHLCAPGAGSAQGLLGGAGQGRLRPGHQLQAVEGEPPSFPPTPQALPKAPPPSPAPPMLAQAKGKLGPTMAFLLITAKIIVFSFLLCLPTFLNSFVLQLACPDVQTCVCSMHHST